MGQMVHGHGARTHPRTRRAALVVIGPCPTKGGGAGERRLLRRVSWLTFDAALAFGAGGGRAKWKKLTHGLCAACMSADRAIEIWNCEHDCEVNNKGMHQDQNFAEFDPENITEPEK